MGLTYNNPNSYNSPFFYTGTPGLPVFGPRYDSGVYDSPDPYDGTEGAGIIFTPPIAVGILPPYLPETVGPAFGLFRHYKPYDAGINVFKLSDGTYVQNYPSSENSNTSIPYPINFYDIGAPYARVYDFQGHETDFVQNPYVVLVYYGAHSYVVDEDEATNLASQGYSDRLS